MGNFLYPTGPWTTQAVARTQKTTGGSVVFLDWPDYKGSVSLACVPFNQAMTGKQTETGRTPREKLREDALTRTDARAVYHILTIRQTHLSEYHA